MEGKTGFRFESGQLDDLANHLLQASALNGDEYAVMQQECGDYINRRAQQSLYIRSLGELYMRCLQIPTQQRDVLPPFGAQHAEASIANLALKILSGLVAKEFDTAFSFRAG